MKETQISAYISQETKDELEKLTRERGLKKGFVLEKDEGTRMKLADRVGRLHGSLLSKTPPPREAFLESRFWECRLCNFLSTCKPFEIEGLELGPILVYDLDNTLLDSRDRWRSSLKDAGLLPDADFKQVPLETRTRFWSIYYGEKFIDLDRTVDRYLSKIRESPNRNIVIVTARPEKLRSTTEDRLRALSIPFRALLMRRENDRAPDRVVKLTWVENLLAAGYRVEEFVSSSGELVEAAQKMSQKYPPAPSPVRAV